jgi:hypothetical protein
MRGNFMIKGVMRVASSSDANSTVGITAVRSGFLNSLSLSDIIIRAGGVFLARLLGAATQFVFFC